MNLVRTRIVPFGAVLLMLGCASTGFGQEAKKRNPTFTVVAAAVNDVPLAAGPSPEVTVGPGDVVAVEVYLRDWSPGGELLRAYQASLDDVSYTSGGSGNLKPRAYDETTGKLEENVKNAFILDDHPRYVFKHTRNRLPMVDSVTPGYRFLNVLPNPQEAEASPQDGSKFYCGTVLMRASDDASGTFTVKLLEDPGSSMLRDNKDENNPILPLDFERLKVHVVPGAGGLRVLTSDVPAKAINARVVRGPGGGTGGAWDRVTFTFNNDASTLKPEDFEVSDGTRNPPKVRQLLRKNGSTLTVVLDRAVSEGRWTTIAHRASRTGVTLGYLPGDVNNDGFVNAQDVFTLIAKAKGDESLPLYQIDIDGDGKVRVRDAIGIVDGLAHSKNPRMYLPK